MGAEGQVSGIRGLICRDWSMGVNRRHKVAYLGEKGHHSGEEPLSHGGYIWGWEIYHGAVGIWVGCWGILMGLHFRISPLVL